MKTIIFVLMAIEFITALRNIVWFEVASKQYFTFKYRLQNNELNFSDIFVVLSLVSSVWVVLLPFISFLLGLLAFASLLVFHIIMEPNKDVESYIMDINEQTKTQAIRTCVVSLLVHVSVYVITYFGLSK